MALSGRCLCGEIQYEVEGELPPLVNCHCQFCRRAHGAAFTTISWVPRQAFRITSGEHHLERFIRGGGYRSFCRKCGTRLFNGLFSDEGFVSVVISTLDEAPLHGPTMHVNLESKASWYEVRDTLPQHDSLPPAAPKAIE